MKKIFTLSFVFAALVAVPKATAFVSPTPAADTEYVSHLRQLTDQSRMKSRHTIAEVSLPTEMITSVPAGETSDFCITGVSYMLTWSGVSMEEFEQKPSQMVETSEGDVYISNIIPSCTCPGWIKGTRDGDVITIPLPQVVDEMSFLGETYSYYAEVLTYVEDAPLDFDAFEVDKAITSITMTKTADGWHLDLPDNGNRILGITSGEGNESWWIGYADIIAEWKPIPWKKNVVPENAVFEDYAMVSDMLGVKVGLFQDGTDMYIKGFTPYFPDSVIKGSIKDGKVVFDSGQYLGIYQERNSMDFIFFLACEYGIIVDEDGFEYYGYYPVDNASLEITEAGGMTMLEEKSLAAAAGLESDIFYSLYWMPEFYGQPKHIDKTPISPKAGEIIPWSASYDFGSVSFYISNLNADGYVLDRERTFYTVSFDGNPVYMPEEDRTGYDPELIPVNYIDWGIVRGWDSLREIRFYNENVSEAVVKMVYLDEDGERYESTPAVILLSTTAVDSPDISSVVKTEYFDLSGCPLLSPTEGVCIMKQISADGKCLVKKVINLK